MPAVLGIVLFAIFGFGLFGESDAGLRAGDFRSGGDSIAAEAMPFAAAPARGPSAPELIRNATSNQDRAGDGDRPDALASRAPGRTFAESAEIAAYSAILRPRQALNYPIYHATGPPPARYVRS